MADAAPAPASTVLAAAATPRAAATSSPPAGRVLPDAGAGASAPAGRRGRTALLLVAVSAFLAAAVLLGRRMPSR